jgi:hypothetical protein
MNPCAYCGELLRIELRRCPQCGEANRIPAAQRVRLDRIRLTIKLGGLDERAAAQFETETVALLRQGLSLAEIAGAMELAHNGRCAGCTTILRHLSSRPRHV